MSSITIYSDIPVNQVNDMIALIELGGGTWTRENQPDGRVTLTATYLEDDPPLDLPTQGRDELEWMSIARAEIGEREVGGSENNPRILEYHATTDNGPKSDAVPWCSSFVNFCMVNSGLKGTNSTRARSWLEWGQSIEQFLPGCVVVLERGAPENGHVGFYVGKKDDDTVLLLGGNQSNAVGVAGFPIERVIDRRLPTNTDRLRQGSMTDTERWQTALAVATTHGASAITAAQDGLPAGVDSSHVMASKDLARAKALLEEFSEAGKRYLVPPALLKAIASRESRVGAQLRDDGFGNDGHAYGIMQIDKRSHALRGNKPNSFEHICQAAEILSSYRSYMLTRHPTWGDEQILRAAVAAYNCGPGRVQDKNDFDARTTGGDYSSDVIARAAIFSADAS